jgi:hypothetical protein
MGAAFTTASSANQSHKRKPPPRRAAAASRRGRGHEIASAPRSYPRTPQSQARRDSRHGEGLPTRRAARHRGTAHDRTSVRNAGLLAGRGCRQGDVAGRRAGAPRPAGPARSSPRSTAAGQAYERSASESPAAGRDDRLTPQAKACLAIIVAEIGNQSSRLLCKSYLGRRLSRSPRTVQRYLGQLRRYGYLAPAELVRSCKGWIRGQRIRTMPRVRPFWHRQRRIWERFTMSNIETQPTHTKPSGLKNNGQARWIQPVMTGIRLE